MNIVVASAFRNSEHYLRRYFKMITALKQKIAWRHDLRLIAGEGDSTDNTKVALARFPDVKVQIVDVTHGGPVYGSTEDPARMAALSGVVNKILDAVTHNDDIVVYVESDLLWDFNTIDALINRAIGWAGGFDVFAPMIFAGQNFYDIWAFRKDGKRFGPFPPFHPGLTGDATIEVDSAGSCLVMRAEIARRCRVKNDYALVGLCEDIRNQGFKIAVCPDLRVRHP